MGEASSKGARPPLKLDVAYDSPAATAVDAAELKWERADDAVQAVEWTLAHDPKAGVAVTESGLVRAFVYEGAVSIKMPTVRVLYQIQEHRIVIRDMHFEEAKAQRHGNA